MPHSPRTIVRFRTHARRVALAGACLLAVAPLDAQGVAGAPATPAARRAARPASGVVAFVGVTVLPMDGERRLPGQTVVVRDGRIAAMGPAARVRVPAGARRVAGRGRFLMPGLAEMHAHVPPGAPNEAALQELMFLYVANGVTTIRGMLGAPYQLVLRDRLASGEMLGPTFYVAAPSLNGNSAPTPDSAAALVRAHRKAGYDLLKIHPGLSRESYDAIVRTAREVGITWGGHVPTAVGVDHALAARQSTIDHMDGYVEGTLPDSLAGRLSGPGSGFEAFVAAVDPSRFAGLARRTREAGVWNVPTAFLWESFYSDEATDRVLQRPEMRYASPQQRDAWARQKASLTAQQVQQGILPATGRRMVALRRQLLKTLADSGAPLLMGTDSPQLFNVPGFALHRELRVAVDAGLTPFQVLESGTRNVARYAGEVLGLDARFGTVAPGQRADLVLLDADPLLDVANLTRRAGVMVRGRWLDAAELERGLAEIAARHGRAP